LARLELSALKRVISMAPVDVNVQVAVTSPAEVDAKFQSALRLIDIGQSSAAVPILQELVKETASKRIRLELARALAFSGQYKEARRLFVFIYKEGPPPAVKLTILRFIDQIDLRRGKFTFSASATKISNPLSQPDAVQVFFLGTPFTIQLNQEDRNLSGIVLNASYERIFNNRYSIRAIASHREMPKHPNADLTSGDFSVGKQIANKPLEIRAGFQFQHMTNQSSNMPYVEIGYRKELTPEIDVQPRVQVGYHSFQGGAGLSGMSYRVHAPVTYSPKPTLGVSIGPRIEFRDTAFAEQRFLSAGLALDAAYTGNAFAVSVTAFPYTTQFWEIDPFWGKRRSDKALFVGAVLSSDHLRVGGFIPTVSPYCGFNSSNITYYKVNNCGISFGARKIF
jgi:hypothetical protein